MKVVLSAVVIQSVASLALGALQCNTQYATTKVSKVPTYTSTVLKTAISTYTYGTHYAPSSTTISYTYVTVIGKKTTTVPTGPSFTPIIDAPKRPPPSSFDRARKRAAPTKYPKQVNCVTTTTSTSYSQIGTATATYTAYATRKIVTSTKNVATSTAYAACETTANFISSVHGEPVDYYWGLANYDVCDVNEYGYGGMEACPNANACCTFAQSKGYAGFVWSNNTGQNHCFLNAVIWGFETGPTDHPYYIGNGPSGSGYYGPPS